MSDSLALPQRLALPENPIRPIREHGGEQDHGQRHRPGHVSLPLPTDALLQP